MSVDVKKIRGIIPCFEKNRGTKEKQGLSATVNRVGQKNRVNRSKVVCEFSLRTLSPLLSAVPYQLGILPFTQEQEEVFINSLLSE